MDREISPSKHEPVPKHSVRQPRNGENIPPFTRPGDKSQPRGIGGWLLVYIILTAIIIAVTIVMVYKLQMPPPQFFSQLRKTPGGQSIADLIYRLSWGYVIACWVWYLLYGWILFALCRCRRGILKYVKGMIIGTPIFNTILPFVAAAVVTSQIPGSDFWGAVRGAYGQLSRVILVCNYLYALAWLAYFILSSRVRDTWPNG